MDLPIEVRHAIYTHLFCHQGSPISISQKYRGLNSFEPSEPIFYTEMFRVCKAIYHDAIAFAYSANEFILQDSYPAFCCLGSEAHRSIKDLTVVHNHWTSEDAVEILAWDFIQTRCTGLKCLEVDLHSDMLLEAVSHLNLFYKALKVGENRPTISLDLYVWERHFSFDPVDREYRRSLALLRGTHEKSRYTPNFVNPRKRVLRLPSSPSDIVFSSDVSPAAVQALDNFLESVDNIHLIKTQRALPNTGRRACGRSARFCYISIDPGKENLVLERYLRP